MAKSVIIAIGSELTRGQIVDTNSAWLACELNRAGLGCQRIALVPDDRELINYQLRQAASESSLVIITGGLGPTLDDITRHSIAEVFGRKLEFSEESWIRVQDFLKRKDRIPVETNKRQCWFPKGAQIQANSVGTADAFILSDKNCRICALPGVPREMKHLFLNMVVPWLSNEFPNRSVQCTQVIKIFGLGESRIASIVESQNVSETIEVAYRVHFPEVWVSLYGDESRHEELGRVSDTLVAAIGSDYVFARSFEKTLPQVVGDELVRRGFTLSVAESCTGGLISDLLVSNPGASRYLLQSTVTYSDESKKRTLGVQEQTLRQFGAVSENTAKEMAEGARKGSGADIGISVTGIAGPDGGTEEKPVGTVCFGLSVSNEVTAFTVCYPSERNSFRKFCAYKALDIVRRYSQEWSNVQ